MEKIVTRLSGIRIDYPLEKLGNPEDLLFIDIETTGFTARSSKLYMIGCVSMVDHIWTATQFFADTYSDEADMLSAFFEFAKPYKIMVHFNGNNFDIPYLVAKVKEHNLPYSFNDFNGIDIYRRITPYKTFLKLVNCKQKTIEAFLKIEREDKFTGGDLIGIYNSYVQNKDPELRKFLLLHNFEDIKGMLEILPVLSFVDLFEEKITVTKVSANTFADLHGKERTELLMTFDLPSQFPVPVSFLFDRCYFAGAANQGMLRVPLYEEELKYYYANYKDYYYLPDEDMALHKSVSCMVDKSHRIKATKETCYTKKTGRFLPEWDAVVTPFFKRDYKDNEMFFELTDERRTDREMFSNYVSHVLEHMVI